MICENFHCNMQAEKGNKTANARMTHEMAQEMAHEINVMTNKNIKALQALHDTPPLCLFLLLHMFWHKKYQCNYQICRFDQIHQLFHKLLSINIILKSIKGHNSVEKFGKIMCNSHNMDHIYQCTNKILSKSIHYF